MKPEKAWAVYSERMGLMFGRIRGTEQAAIENFEQEMEAPWAELQDLGYRCLQVEIKPVKKG